MLAPDALIGGRPSSLWRQQQLLNYDTQHFVIKAHRVVISLLSLTCGALLVVCNHLARPSSTSYEADAALIFLLVVAVSYLSYECTWPRAAAVAAAGLAGRAAWHPAAACSIIYQAAVWGSHQSSIIVLACFFASHFFYHLEQWEEFKQHADKTRNVYAVLCPLCALLSLSKIARVAVACSKQTCTVHMLWGTVAAVFQAGLSILGWIGIHAPQLWAKHKCKLDEVTVACLIMSMCMPALSWLYPIFASVVCPYVWEITIPALAEAALDMWQLFSKISLLLASYDEALSCLPGYCAVWMISSRAARERKGARNNDKVEEIERRVFVACATVSTVSMGLRCVLLAFSGWRLHLLTVHAAWRFVAILAGILGIALQMEVYLGDSLEDALARATLVTWFAAKVVHWGIWAAALWSQQCFVVGQH